MDFGKPRMDLLPPHALLAVAHVMSEGAKKYSPDNYRKGIRHRGLYASALRHMNAWLAGENTDAESGANPLHHAAADLLMLIQMQHDHPELDDRFKVTKETTNEVKGNSGGSSTGSVCSGVLRDADDHPYGSEPSYAFVPNYGC